MPGFARVTRYASILKRQSFLFARNIVDFDQPLGAREAGNVHQRRRWPMVAEHGIDCDLTDGYLEAGWRASDGGLNDWATQGSPATQQLDQATFTLPLRSPSTSMNSIATFTPPVCTSGCLPRMARDSCSFRRIGRAA